jgi:hypothetical protein
MFSEAALTEREHNGEAPQLTLARDTTQAKERLCNLINQQAAIRLNPV